MKTDITINKGYTFAMAPYESIRPGMSITFKDVPIEKIQELHPLFERLSSRLSQLRITKDMEEYYEVVSFKDGIKYMKNVSENFDEIIEQINSDLENINAIIE